MGLRIFPSILRLVSPILRRRVVLVVLVVVAWLLLLTLLVLSTLIIRHGGQYPQLMGWGGIDVNVVRGRVLLSRVVNS